MKITAKIIKYLCSRHINFHVLFNILKKHMKQRSVDEKTEVHGRFNSHCQKMLHQN